MTVDEFLQAQVLGEGGWQEQAALATRRWSSKTMRIRSGLFCGSSLFPGGFLFQNHYPRFRGAPSGFLKGCPQGPPSVDSG